MKIGWQMLIGLVVVALAAGGAALLVSLRPDIEPEPPEVPAPAVRIVTVAPRDVRLVVVSEGTVAPRTESALVAEVAGRVLETSPALVAGGFFEEGDVLLRIDGTDVRAALARAEAALAQARLRLEREQAEARVQRAEWEELGLGEAPPLAAREPQLADALAGVESAERELHRARTDVERTRLRAPYRGRVRSETVDVGQFVNRGEPVARLYAIDAAEVRLAVPDASLAWLDVPLSPGRFGAGPEVVLRASLAGERREWTGRIVRTDGAIDPRTRLIHLVARVDDPYGLESDARRAPLLAGLFVEAEIRGIEARNVVPIPRVALREGDVVWVVDDDERLRIRDVEVLRREADRVLVRSGLDDGDRVVVSPLDLSVDGMDVRVETDGEVATPETAGVAGAEGAATNDAEPGR